MMQTYGGKTMPIVSSEWGYSCAPGSGLYTVANSQVQGDYYARSYLVNLSQGISIFQFVRVEERQRERGRLREQLWNRDVGPSAEASL